MLTDEFSPLHFCHGGSSFFGLVIKNLLKKECIMFVMVNTLYLKQLHETQEEKLTESRKSEIEIHCVTLQILDN